MKINDYVIDHCRSWSQAVTEHVALSNVVDVMDDFLSPLIFGSYTVNMFFICIHVIFNLQIQLEYM